MKLKSLVMPYFLENRESYMEALDIIAKTNFID